MAVPNPLQSCPNSGVKWPSATGVKRPLRAAGVSALCAWG